MRERLTTRIPGKLAAAAVALFGLMAAGPVNAEITFRAAASAAAQGTVPAFRGASSANTRTASLAIGKPAGTAPNDVLIASIAVGPSTATIAPPEGWILVRRLDNPATSSNSLAVFYKVA